MFPELVSQRGFRFINPGGLTGSPDYSFDANDVVAPALVRDGSGVYICRRMMPKLPEGVNPEDPVLQPTRAPSFGHRLRRLFQLMAEKPGRIWPIYTHLGAIEPLEELPNPYLEREPLEELQDRVYGITGRFQREDRCWFVRGTGMCEHALLMQQIARHVERPDVDCVVIRSWIDETLGYELPVSVNQTYGLTFRVDRLERARVELAGRAIGELARFDHADGRWVTAMPSAIREVVFDAVNPLSRSGADFEADRVKARPDATELVGGSLQLRGPRWGTGRVSFTPTWIDPAGHQAFTYRVEGRTRNAALAWLIETAGGARFAWGSRPIVKSLDGLTAWRAEPVSMNATVTVPFWDLTWAKGAVPGGPLPTREILRMTILIRGRVDVSVASFIRPSPAQRDEPVGGVVVSGFVPMEHADKLTIKLRAETDGPEQHCRPDPRGWFAFPGVQAAVARVWAEDRNGTRYAPRGGELIETRWNQTSLAIDQIA